jgi:hypothetical protein
MDTPIADLTKSYRYYLIDRHGLEVCPECGSKLTNQLCVLMIFAESLNMEADLVVNLAEHSLFCNKCPVVAIDRNTIKEIIDEGINEEKIIRYQLKGLIDVEAIPKEKRKFDQLNAPGNVLPVVPFLPALTKDTATNNIKQGRNERCNCGSGRKFKNCCAKQSTR